MLDDMDDNKKYTAWLANWSGVLKMAVAEHGNLGMIWNTEDPILSKTLV